MGYYINLSNGLKVNEDDKPKFLSTEQNENATFSGLIVDAFSQVFYSMGLCMGVHYSYASYNHIKAPVILNAFVIGIISFIFSFLNGFIAYGVNGYLTALDDSA